LRIQNSQAAILARLAVLIDMIISDGWQEAEFKGLIHLVASTVGLFLVTLQRGCYHCRKAKFRSIVLDGIRTTTSSRMATGSMAGHLFTAIGKSLEIFGFFTKG
jgi:hypothetical protein